MVSVNDNGYDYRKMKKQTEEFIRIQDLWMMAISKWYWFLISMIIALLAAFIYIAVTPPIYKRVASILIRDNPPNGMSPLTNVTSFSDIGLIKPSININNEILTFKSPLLMQEVVTKLKLDEDYKIEGLFRDKVLYEKTPVIVILDSLISPDVPLSFYIELLPQNKVELSNFIINGEEYTFEGNLSEPIKTPLGDITVLPTAFYSEDYNNEQIFFSKSSIKETVDYYVSALNATLSNENATIIAITINDVSIQRAEDILNTLITVYNENWIKDKNQIAVSTSLFIDERLKVIESELGNVDDNISQFKSENLIPDVQAASNIYMARSNENNAKILALNTRYSIANYILLHLKKPTAREQLLPANLGIENVNIEELISKYNTTLLRRNTLLDNSGSKNPLVSDMDQSLATMRNAIINSINNLLVTLDTQIKDIEDSENQINERIASSPKQAKYLLSIERQQKVKEALYLFLLQKREESQLSQAFTTYNTQIITPASGKLYPSAPKKMNILAIAVIIGLLLPLVVLFILENLNPSVRGRKDLSSLNIPFIGEIPQIIRNKTRLSKRKVERNRDDIVVEEGKKDYMNEAFRVVRTNLNFIINSNANKHQKVIMFTSFNIDSGKTFVSINLAISMAIKGNKVVVVDLDMRKASLSIYANSPSNGVSNYLGKMVNNLDEIIVKGTIHPNLDIIPVGTIPPNPSELLLDERLSYLLNELKERYDYIFLDCTPVEIVTDASIVGEIADFTVFVVRVGLTDRRILSDIEEVYRKKQFNNISILLNGSQYISKYGYRYGYSYGYGGDYSI